MSILFGVQSKSHFNWQYDYFVASVSKSMIDLTRNYIKQQEEHHKIKSFKEEYNEFVEKHGFDGIIDFLAKASFFIEYVTPGLSQG